MKKHEAEESAISVAGRAELQHVRQKLRWFLAAQPLPGEKHLKAVELCEAV
jgi:hypothetical protein